MGMTLGEAREVERQVVEQAPDLGVQVRPCTRESGVEVVIRDPRGTCSGLVRRPEQLDIWLSPFGRTRLVTGFPRRPASTLSCEDAISLARDAVSAGLDISSITRESTGGGYRVCIGMPGGATSIALTKKAQLSRWLTTTGRRYLAGDPTITVRDVRVAANEEAPSGCD